MSPPLVSIVVPLFNKEKYIIPTLRSVSLQTYTNWECLIIDDGSEDGSLLAVKRFIEATPGNWKVLSQVNAGPSSARNLGIKLAGGKYIAFIDADDIWLHKKLEIQVQTLEENPDLSLLLSNYIIFNDSHLSTLRGVKARNVRTQIRRWLDMRGFGGLVESTGILRSSDLRDDLLFDASLSTAEGLDFVVKWALLRTVRVSPNFLTLYRISENQLHTNIKLIEQNAATLAEKYSEVLHLGKKTLKRQNAYFELAKMRSWRRPEILRQMFCFLLSLNFEVLFMSIWILDRNLRASLLSLRTKRIVKSHLLRIHL